MGATDARARARARKDTSVGQRESPPEKRAKHYEPLIQGAPTGDAALATAWDWLRKELVEMDGVRPEDSQRTRRELAQVVAGYAKRMPTYRPK